MLVNRLSNERPSVSVSTNAPDTNMTPSTTASPDRTSRSLRDRTLLSVARSMSGHRPDGVQALHGVQYGIGGRRGQLADHLAVGQEQDPVGVRRGVRVVGDHDDGLAELAPRPAQE